MKKVVFIVIALVLIGLAWFLLRERGQTPNLTMNNEAALNNGNTTPIITEEVAYFQEARGYFVRPEAAGQYPGVVMIHENRGLRPEIRSMAEQLAREGYLVLAVDLLGDVVETQEEARALTADFNQATGIANMRAAAAYLRQNGAEKIASLGWCFGGRQSLELALSGEELDATVIYYGSGMATSTARLAPLKWPVLGIFGDQDQAIPVQTVDQFRTSLDTLEVENEIYIYPGVGHAFANPSGPNYAPEATADAWAKTLAFLDQHLK